VPRSAINGLDIVPIDVSELEPPEPMERILTRLQQLQAGQLLRVRHRREPFPLYPMLEEAGYKYCCVPSGTEAFLIYIWPQSVPVKEAFCRNDAAGEAR
jgi:uncharacterized protein (DUF2249 family)